MLASSLILSITIRLASSVGVSWGVLTGISILGCDALELNCPHTLQLVVAENFHRPTGKKPAKQRFRYFPSPASSTMAALPTGCKLNQELARVKRTSHAVPIIKQRWGQLFADQLPPIGPSEQTAIKTAFYNFDRAVLFDLQQRYSGPAKDVALQASLLVQIIAIAKDQTL